MSAEQNTNGNSKSSNKQSKDTAKGDTSRQAGQQGLGQPGRRVDQAVEQQRATAEGMGESSMSNDQKQAKPTSKGDAQRDAPNEDKPGKTASPMKTPGKSFGGKSTDRPTPSSHHH